MNNTKEEICCENNLSLFIEKRKTENSVCEAINLDIRIVLEYVCKFGPRLIAPSHLGGPHKRRMHTVILHAPPILCK